MPSGFRPSWECGPIGHTSRTEAKNTCGKLPGVWEDALRRASSARILGHVCVCVCDDVTGLTVGALEFSSRGSEATKATYHAEIHV